MNYQLHIQAHLPYLAIIILQLTALAFAHQPQPYDFITSILPPSSYNTDKAANFSTLGLVLV
jgi:hypothetical protein